jgi:uncharacterized protein (DUF924 family)
MTGPEDVLAAWFAPPEAEWQTCWFTADSAFDARLRENFAECLTAARQGELDRWAETPRGALALAIVLDQFSRNLCRNTPQAFAVDAKARAVARSALAQGFDQKLSATERIFLYLPFQHSEDAADQELSVRLFETLPNGPDLAQNIGYALRHRDVIERFGRFPHRNAVLDRSSTAAELAFLRDHPEGF